MMAATALSSSKADVRVKLLAAFVICVITSRDSFLFSVGEQLQQITSAMPKHMRPLKLEAIKQEPGLENEIAQITNPSAALVSHVVARGMQNDLQEAALHGTADARPQGAASQQASKRQKQQKPIIKYEESDSDDSNRVAEVHFPAHPLMLQPPQISSLQPQRCRWLMSMLANGGRHLKDFPSWIQIKTKDDNIPC